MTLSSGQVPVGPHIPYAGSSPGNREAAAERHEAARDQASQHQRNIRDCQERRQGPRLGSAPLRLRSGTIRLP
jgi:hypothetical protein